MKWWLKNPRNFMEYKKIMKSFDFCIYSNSIQYWLFLMVINDHLITQGQSKGD